ILDGRAAARRERAAAGSARLRLHGHARVRARVPRRALRRRSARRRRADRRGAARGAVRGAAVQTRVPRRRDAGGARARGELMLGLNAGEGDRAAVSDARPPPDSDARPRQDVLDDGPERGEAMLRMGVTRQRALLFGVFVLAALAFLYFVLPQLGGFQHTWNRLGDGDAWWIAVAALMEVLSIVSYIAIFRGVAVPRGSPIT